MDMKEISKQYRIPIEILQECESWGLCDYIKMTIDDDWEENQDENIMQLSMILTLHDAGFDYPEIAKYMRLFLQGDVTKSERMRILKQQRDRTLDKIHFQERCLDRLDYLRYQIQKEKKI